MNLFVTITTGYVNIDNDLAVTHEIGVDYIIEDILQAKQQPDNENEKETLLLLLPPQVTGKEAYMALLTLRHFAQLYQNGSVLFHLLDRTEDKVCEIICSRQTQTNIDDFFK